MSNQISFDLQNPEDVKQVCEIFAKSNTLVTDNIALAVLSNPEILNILVTKHGIKDQLIKQIISRGEIENQILLEQKELIASSRQDILDGIKMAKLGQIFGLIFISLVIFSGIYALIKSEFNTAIALFSLALASPILNNFVSYKYNNKK